MKKATFKETEATYEDKLAMIMAVGDATIEEASRALEECGGDINHALAFVNNQAPTPSTGTASSSSSLHNAPYKPSKTARRMEDVDDESIAKPRESLRHAPTLVARRQPFVAAATAPKGPKENVFFHVPISSLPIAAASHPHPSLAAAASAASRGGERVLTPRPPQRTTLPGAFAVGGSDASQIGDDGNYTITSPLPENISAAQPPTQQVVPVTARLVVDNSDDYVESLEEKLQQREEELARIRQNHENIVVGQVLGVNNNDDKPNDEEEGINNDNTITSNNNKSIFGLKRKVLIVGLIAILAVIAVIVGVAVAASSNLQQNAPESQSSPVNSPTTAPPTQPPMVLPTVPPTVESSPVEPQTVAPTQSPTLLPTFAPTAALTSTTQSPAPLCDESSSSLAKRLPCYSQNKTWLDLYDNSLTGMIPSQLGLLTKLTYLNLGDNSLTGTIPSQVGLLSNLTLLLLSENSLKGTIPSQLAMMPNLSSLVLSINSLTGTIPSQLALMSNLTWLELYGNNFTGEFTCPDFIGLCRISCDHFTNNTCRSL
jgi:hypothetical protein